MDVILYASRPEGGGAVSHYISNGILNDQNAHQYCAPWNDDFHAIASVRRQLFQMKHHNRQSVVLPREPRPVSPHSLPDFTSLSLEQPEPESEPEPVPEPSVQHSTMLVPDSGAASGPPSIIIPVFPESIVNYLLAVQVTDVQWNGVKLIWYRFVKDQLSPTAGLASLGLHSDVKDSIELMMYRALFKIV